MTMGLSAAGYILLFLVPLMLVSAQSVWRSAVSNSDLFSGGIADILVRVFTNPRIWVGGLLYLVTTLLYLLVLSKTKFFTAQMIITSAAIIYSALIAHFIFHEKISPLNIVGVGLILVGIFFIISK